MVDDYINSVEQLLAGDKYKVVGIDLQYTAGRPGIDQKVAVAQLCVRHHVLIYHYCMAIEPCDRFNRFVDSTDYKFATVETTDTCPLYLLFQTLLPLFWTLTCMI